MKLNKKGFAFSTMLYGSVALIVAVLYIILNVNKESVDTTYYFGEEILADLNECVTEEIALENCYSAGGSNCNPTAYHGCLGVSDNQGHENGVIISTTLKSKVDVAGEGLILDTYYEQKHNEKRYIYVGTSAKNYLSFANKTWRIVSIESTGYIKLLDTTKISSVAWDNGSKGVWGNNSTLYEMLNNSYLTSIYDTSKLFQGSWNKILLLPSLATNNKYNINTLLDQEEPITQSDVISAKVGILTLGDYIKATDNDSCKEDLFDSETNNCNSWLTEYKGWVLDISGEFGSDNDGYAYYMGNQTVSGRSYTNVPVLDHTNELHDVYPVIYLDRNSVIKGGTGTSSDPYVLK